MAEVRVRSIVWSCGCEMLAGVRLSDALRYTDKA
jgi:hypothetical protein